MVYDWIEVVDFRLARERVFSIWYEEESMGFIKDGSGPLKFSDLESSLDYIEEELSFKEELLRRSFNLDYIGLNARGDLSKMDRQLILDFWNIGLDFSSTFKLEFLGELRTEEVKNIYNKLFFSSGLDIFKEEENLDWDFSLEETSFIGDVLLDGLRLFKENLF